MVSQRNCVGISQTHRSQVNGNERCISDQVSVRAKQCAGEVESFLDIGADGSLLEATTHSLRDTHEPVGEECQQNGIWPPWFAHRCSCTSETIVEAITSHDVDDLACTQFPRLQHIRDAYMFHKGA